MPITAIYAALLGLLFVVLSIRVVAARRRARVRIGDGGDETLRRRIRAQGNFAEYVPIALILLGLGETAGLPPYALHVMGLALLVGRALHAANISTPSERIPLRVVGMAITFTVILVASIANLMLALPKL